VVHSLDVTDVATGWTETRALKTKARRWVLEALHNITATLPFPLLGIDCDNGGEFINEELHAYCKEHRLTFTRSRPYRKNDSCFVEQKNYSIVRHTVGYERLDSDEALSILQELYPPVSLFTNYFQPSMKLVKKTRTGSKVKKDYDYPKTPYLRLSEYATINPAIRSRLTHQYRLLNPAALRRQISQLQEQLTTIVSKTKYLRKQQKAKHLESILQ
jgi:hypothetical protein